MSVGHGRRSLLVLACSARKSARVRRGPAWEVYDGRVYQVLKKLLRDHPSWRESLDILIVSARHGVIDSKRVVSIYDDRLTSARSADLARRSARQLRRNVAGRYYQAAHANLGRIYREAVPDLSAILAPAPIDWASGGIGARNAQTRGWVADCLEAAGLAVTCGTARPRSLRR